MNNPTKKSGASKSKADRNRPGPSNVRRLFEDAYYTYTQAVRDAQLRAQQVVAEADHDYHQAQQAVQADAQKRSWEVYLAYVKASHDALEKDDSKAADEARRDYEEALQQVHRETQQRSLEAHSNHLQSLADASTPDNVQKGVEEAYRNYLRDLQKVWDQVDVDSLDPNSLAAISQGVAAAALSLCGALGHSAGAS